MRYNKKIFIIMFSIFIIAVLVSFSYAHFVKEEAQGNEITNINMITKSNEDLTGIAKFSYNNDNNIININTIPSTAYSTIYKFKVDYLTSELNAMMITLQNKVTNITGNDSTYQLYECNESDYNISTNTDVDSLCVLNNDGILSNVNEQPLLIHELNTNVTKYYILKINLINNTGKYFNAIIKYREYENPYISGQLITYTGSYQKIEIFQSGTYRIELWGAQGGQYSNYNYAHSGRGGYTKGVINLARNQALYIYLGQRNDIYSTGTFNCSINYSCGGASDVRFFNGEFDESFYAWDNDISLNSRIMVAAGGGYFYPADYSYSSSGYGGGLIGGGGSDTGGGTQFTFGVNINSSPNNGEFGIGGGGYGGGGGYYGGGGGYNSYSAGGSSFISGHAGCVAIASESNESNPRITRIDSNGVLCSSSSSAGYNASGYNTDPLCSEHYSGKVFTETLMIDGAGYKWEIVDGVLVKTLQSMPNPLGGFYASGVGHTGAGYARITYIDEQ